MVKRLLLAALGIGSLIVYRSSGGAGFSVTSVNGIEHVSGASNVRALVAALVVLVAYFVALDPEPDEKIGETASTTRRAMAWMMDFFLSFAACSALIALLALGAEALTTGQFQWRFERDSATSLDWVLASVGIGLLFMGMALYWGLPAPRGGQTIGQAVFGLRVVSRSDQPPRLRACLLRGMLQPFAPLLWFTRFFSTRGSYFHDELANVQVVETRPVYRAA